MELPERPIVVMRPDNLVEGAVESGTWSQRTISLIAGGPYVAYVARGAGWMRTPAGETMLQPGMLVSAPAGPFDCVMSEDQVAIVVTMREDCSEKHAFVPPLARQLSAEDGEAWRLRLTYLLELAENGRLRDADITGVRTALARMVWRKDAPYARDTLMSIFHWVSERAGEPLTLAAIAAQAGYTPNYLNDLSRIHTGRPLGKWLTDMRMTRARHELESTDRPIAEIGASFGYDDPAYFSRAFRRLHGVPPAVWRMAKSPGVEDPRIAIPLLDLKEKVEHGVEPLRAYSIAS